jgi:beta-phosphoglucomutase-like phosphatase (HAD superfamily)/D-arabinose 5-phosphate isomerase GutQ
MDILHYDLYLFDFDGTIVDTEPLHYKAYKQAFADIAPDFELSYIEYCKYKHGNDTTYINSKFTADEISNITKKKEVHFYEILASSDIKLIDGIEDFLNLLFENGKQVCVVTHSSNNRVNAVKSNIPILKKITHWVTLESYKHKKPHPESYICGINKFKKIPLHRIIAFEDTYIGYSAIAKLNITSVLINNKDYIYYDAIKCPYKFNNYNELLESDAMNNNNSNINSNSNSNINSINSINKGLVASNEINNKIDLYVNQISQLRESYTRNVCLMYNILNECKGMVYILGVGKNMHIANKCVSTWKSYGIKANTINTQDLFHGDFGIFTDSDYIIYISNSGNTVELIDTAKYINHKFNMFQISVSNTINSELSKYTNIELCLSDMPIQEADDINMAPTVSSSVIMMFLDLVGIYYAKEHEYTKERFQLYHPGGKLGMTKPLHTVFIFAAGKGTRLRPYTNNIPKLLVNINNETLLYKITKYWTPYTNNFVIVVNPEYVNIVDYYMKLYNLKNYKIVSVDITTQENSYTIRQAVTPDYYGKNILFTWCDIYPNDPLDKSIFGSKNIIFTHGNNCRYLATNDSTITKHKNGNIIGIYYFNEYTPLSIQEDSMDLCDCYSLNYISFESINIGNLTDIGDMYKYIQIIKNKKDYKTRDFNEITEISDSLLLKKAVDNKGIEIIQKEMNWYKTNDRFDFIPRIYEYNTNSFIMEKLGSYVPLYEVYHASSNIQKYPILDEIIDKLRILHNKETQITADRYAVDFTIEYNTKIHTRLKSIRQLLDEFKITHVNELEITCSIDEILTNINDSLWDYFKDTNKYHMIHGDCQFSNILYNSETNDVKFIDPRGYFGNTMNYGQIEYDYSKIVYALSGYDIFNNNMSFINLEDKNITIQIPFDDDSINYFVGKVNIPYKIMIAMIVIHWLGLAEYTKNNVAKCVNAYYYGIYLYITLFTNTNTVTDICS